MSQSEPRNENLKAVPNRRRRKAGAALIVAAASLATLAFLFIPCSAESRAPREESAARRSNPASPPPDSLQAKIKELSVLPPEQPRSFQPIVITESEANEYLKAHGQEFLPPAVQDPEIHILAGHVAGGAEIDFDKLGQLGKDTKDIGSQVLATLFKGKQKVTASGKLETADGHGQVTIQDLRIGATTVPDWLTKAMLEKYLQDNYKVDLDKPFLLPDHVTHIDLADGKATFVRSPGKKQD